MAKRARRTRRTQTKSGTNWMVVGIIVAIGVVGLFALLGFSLFGEDALVALGLSEPQLESLAAYCLENSEYCVTAGDNTAPVSFVEVSDFGCPHCRDFHVEKADTIMEQYVDTGRVQWVVLPYALRAETLPAANASLCAEEQGSYFEFSAALFNQSDTAQSLTQDGFLSAANEIGLDTEPFVQCLEEGRYNALIVANQEAARTIGGVTGTPTFFVNDQPIRGNVPLAEFERAFNQYLGS